MINSAGSDAIRLALGAVPMLILSLTIVGLLQGAGAIDLLQQLLKPLLSWLHIPQNFVLPALVKCVAGGTAVFGVISELIQQGKVTVDQVNASAGLLIQTFDLPGIGVSWHQLTVCPPVPLRGSRGDHRYPAAYRSAPDPVLMPLLWSALSGRPPRAACSPQAMRSSTRVIIHGKNGLEVTRINVSSPTLSVPVSPRSEMVPRLMP